MVINSKLAGTPGQTWAGLDLRFKELFLWKFFSTFFSSNVGLRSLSNKIANFSHITVLHVSRNQLSTLPSFLFESCRYYELSSFLFILNMLFIRNLTTLDASCNIISYIPPEIGELGKVFSLFLRHIRFHTEYNS